MVQYKHEYDDIIIKHLYGGGSDGEGGHHYDCFETFGAIFRLMKKSGYPGISKTTLQRHLNKMLNQGILIKYEGDESPDFAQRIKRVLYGLSGDAYWDFQDGWAHGRFQRVETKREPRSHHHHRRRRTTLIKHQHYRRRHRHHHHQ
jgi:hypothetical protein